MPISRSSLRRFRIVWVLLGVSLEAFYAMWISSPLITGRSPWEACIVLALASGGGAYLQGRWARTWGLRLPVNEFAILVGIGALVQGGFYILQTETANAVAQWVLFVLSLLIIVAAPVPALRRAGVKIPHWWLWSGIGIAVSYLFEAFFTGFLYGAGAPAYAYQTILPTLNRLLSVWFASHAVGVVLLVPTSDRETGPIVEVGE